MLFTLSALRKPADEFLERRVTLSRLKAPLLFAYDAYSFRRRLKGLHGVPALGPTDALILRPCSAIHTFGLTQNIDVVFLNRYGEIRKVLTVAPRRIRWCWNASVVIEMAEGTARRINLQPGQVFEPSEGHWL